LIFTDKETDYIRSQIIARIATTNAGPTKRDSIKGEDSDSNRNFINFGQPDVVPVGFDFDGIYFYIGGMNLNKTLKYKNISKNNKVALVIDDLETINPWRPRGIRVYGIADVVTRQGGYMSFIDNSQTRYLRIRPKKKWSWGIENPIFMGGKFKVERESSY